MTIRLLLFSLFGFLSCGDIAVAQGNERIKSFNSAKKVLREVYRHWQMQDDTKDIANTIYCQCRYTNAGVDHKSCGYIVQRKSNPREHRIEWEHVVPASMFGRQFDEWANKDTYKRCIKKTGRQCAGLLSPQFSLMEGDMYNLYPAVGAVNEARSNYPMGEFADSVVSDVSFGACDFKRSDNVVQPRKDIRGDIARVYFYICLLYTS